MYIHAQMTESGAAEEANSLAAVIQDDHAMRMLCSPFVQNIDFSAIPVPETSGRDGGPIGFETDSDRMIALKPLQTLLSELFDKLAGEHFGYNSMPNQKPRQAHASIWEHIRRRHGVRRVVMQKAWQFVESLMMHREDPLVRLFTDFLDGTRTLDELIFLLYLREIKESHFRRKYNGIGVKYSHAKILVGEKWNPMTEIIFIAIVKHIMSSYYVSIFSFLCEKLLFLNNFLLKRLTKCSEICRERMRCAWPISKRTYASITISKNLP